MVVDNLNNAFYTTPEEDIDEITNWDEHSIFVGDQHVYHSSETFKEWSEWCNDNCWGQYMFESFLLSDPKVVAALFEFTDDAMAFKLRWT